VDAVAKTAWYCCGVRAADARRPRPLCGDHLAERFMDDAAWQVFRRFERMRFPNASNAMRHRVVDDWLRERIAARPDLPVLLLGAGFDTRAFRLGGGRWLELDQAALLALKEAKLPAASAPQPLQRLAIDFAREPLAEVLAPWAGMPAAVVVMEGVSMYIDAAALRANAQALQRMLPGHTLICDLMDARFMRRYGGPVRREIRALGGDFVPALDDPAGFVASLGYRETLRVSIAQAAAARGALPIPLWLMRTPLFTALREGYRLHVFESQPAAA
jgi:methyltransferase (TIGR00027 family)